RGRLPRLGRLAVALSLLLIASAGCGESGATGPQRPGENTGTNDSVTPADRLAGTWRATVLIEVPGDVQAWITTWEFDSDGTCLQIAEVRSVVESTPRVTERPCTFTADGFEIAITYTGGSTLTFNYAFPLFSSDRLILDGLEYERVVP
ncbi:MAG TPA: hypothetical protein VF061_08750, partial [Gemmatimonadales bacterium]